jgi:phosphopentomutase
MPRAFVIVLDSAGIGATPDAVRYGDAGADTIGHIAQACATGMADRAGLRCGPLYLPNLARMGLGEACCLATGRVPPGLALHGACQGRYAAAAEIASGKDTPSGHWEMAGTPPLADWHYFPDTEPAFPPALIASLCARADLPGILGNCHASGTEIIARLGEEHRRSGKPICYTSADSVFQIAAHEDSFGLPRLYQTCSIARELLDPLHVGRVIARPFTGEDAASFVRTSRRRDYTMPPPTGTILERAEAGGRPVVSIGKIADIFAHRATGRVIKTVDDADAIQATASVMETLADGGLAFANLNDFDTLYGHRRDVAGYAAALERFDARLPNLAARLRSGDLVIVTADHGNDPTWHGTDHTREHVPVIAFGPGLPRGNAGLRPSFAVIAATLAAHLGLGTEPETLWN